MTFIYVFNVRILFSWVVLLFIEELDDKKKKRLPVLKYQQAEYI
jgi:hypothetical protein